MRKHFYLITEHEQSDRVGGVATYDTRFAASSKNEAEPITIHDKDTGEFRDIGEKVYLGYNDFESDDPSNETYIDVIKDKVRSVDRGWVEKAGMVDVYYGENNDRNP